MSFQRALTKQQLSSATLSYSPIFIIGLMSTGRFGSYTRPLAADQGSSASRSFPCSRPLVLNHPVHHALPDSVALFPSIDGLRIGSISRGDSMDRIAISWLLVVC